MRTSIIDKNEMIQFLFDHLHLVRENNGNREKLRYFLNDASCQEKFKRQMTQFEQSPSSLVNPVIPFRRMLSDLTDIKIGALSRLGKSMKEKIPIELDALTNDEIEALALNLNHQQACQVSLANYLLDPSQLDQRFKRIKTIARLFPNITSVDCSCNNLGELAEKQILVLSTSLSFFSKATYFNLSGNKLSSLSWRQNQSLREKSFPNVTRLNLSNNNLGILSNNEIHALTRLIKKVFPNLKEVNLSSSNLRKKQRTHFTLFLMFTPLIFRGILTEYLTTV